ncbi:MAG: SUMF1/EgtB/PvdO family nonheme iron enzyme [Myxococcales bacterium]|nr:SUMF1/EgtB/PvdO family nonheme iron enzyme [Myxococcales bacterium]
MAFEIRAGALLAGKLRLVRPLGQGGMGVVWVARHETLDTDVAVKLIRPERVAADPALVARFELEAKATARIAHPNVVQVMDFGTVDGTVPFIVMELLEGFSLAELLASGGRLSFATTRLLVEQVGGALAVAHERGVVHRDIKPHNVFIVQKGADDPLRVKVLDFGIAKLLGDAQVPGFSPALTETGTIVGSPPYMSPEQIEGSRHIDLRSDLWSLGVIVYEALTGKLPFQGGSFVAVGARVLEGKYTPAIDLRGGLPRAIDDWLAKALCVGPEGRFQSARELVAAFRELGQPTEDAAPSARGSPPAAFATTVEAPMPAGPTASHAPAADQARRFTRRRVVTAGVVASVALAGGIAASASALRGPGACPAGMKRIDGGSFRMGSLAEGETPSDETPAHAESPKAFCLDATEVTVGAYADCRSCDPLLGSVQGEGLTPNGVTFWSQFCNRADQRDQPVNCVDWEHASAYCEARGLRLPTEAEWELAARGPAASTYPWGEAPPTGERVNACGAECSRMLTERLAKSGRAPWPRMYADDDSAPATAAVGSRPTGATPAGILDLSGNVWEWTSSHYCRYDSPECGDSRRVIRGGGWDTVESQDVRAARRLPSAPTARSWSVGFRCAKSL